MFTFCIAAVGYNCMTAINSKLVNSVSIKTMMRSILSNSFPEIAGRYTSFVYSNSIKQ